jgi:hypothetical protein
MHTLLFDKDGTNLLHNININFTHKPAVGEFISYLDGSYEIDCITHLVENGTQISISANAIK